MEDMNSRNSSTAPVFPTPAYRERKLLHEDEENAMEAFKDYVDAYLSDPTEPSQGASERLKKAWRSEILTEDKFMKRANEQNGIVTWHAFNPSHEYKERLTRYNKAGGKVSKDEKILLLEGREGMTGRIIRDTDILFITANAVADQTIRANFETDVVFMDETGEDKHADVAIVLVNCPYLIAIFFFDDEFQLPPHFEGLAKNEFRNFAKRSVLGALAA